MTLQEFKDQNKNIPVVTKIGAYDKNYKINEFSAFIIVDEGILIPEGQELSHSIYVRFLSKEKIKEIYKKFILEEE